MAELKNSRQTIGRRHSLGALLRACDDIQSTDPAVFESARRRLVTREGERMLSMLHDVHIALAAEDAAPDIGEQLLSVGPWCSAAGGATIVRHRPAHAHAIDRVGLETFGECHPGDFAPATATRPNFKAVRWHAVAGSTDVELMPHAAVREAFVLLLSGEIHLTVDGAQPNRMRAHASAAGLWLGGVSDEPWLPRFGVSVTASADASGILILLSETGVPLIELPHDGPMSAARSHCTPVMLAPSSAPPATNLFWRGLGKLGIKKPKTFVIPRRRNLARWAERLPDFSRQPLTGYPHDTAFKAGILYPRELPKWQNVRSRIQGRTWPTLLFRVIQVPPIGAEGLAELERHPGGEILVAWSGCFCLLTDATAIADSAKMEVSLHSDLGALQCRKVEACSSDSFDVVIINSDRLHGVVGAERRAVALHFATPRLEHSDAWRGLSEHALLGREASRGQG